MNQKKIPFSLEQIREIIKDYPTPFHIYDEKAMQENTRNLLKAFAWNKGFKEFYSVKAAPNPFLMKIFKEEKLGADCSSFPELT